MGGLPSAINKELIDPGTCRFSGVTKTAAEATPIVSDRRPSERNGLTFNPKRPIVAVAVWIQLSKVPTLDVDPKNRGLENSPKMDGLFISWKLLVKWMIWEVPLYFGNTYILWRCFSQIGCASRMFKQVSFWPPKSKEKSRISCILHKIMASSIIKIKAIHLNIQSMC